MIDAILAAAIWIGPTPQADTVRTQNISAASQARDIPRKWEAFTLCISERESGFGRTDDTSKSYRAANPTSSAQGRYQFLDRQWRHGAGWNVWKRLIRFGYDRATAKVVLKKLHDTPIKRWKPIYQDIAFAEALLSGKGQGWKHWYLAGSRCNGLVPA